MRMRSGIVCLLLTLCALLPGQNDDSFIPIDPAAPNCLSAECHAPLLRQEFLHAPVSQGDCDVCHLIIERDEAELYGEKIHPLRTLKPKLNLCSECHTQFAETHSVVHRPILEDCSSCHDPHGGSQRYFFNEQSAGELCLACHKDVTENMEFIHGPVALKDCLSCHTAHASEFKGLLSRPRETLCARCHVALFREQNDASSIHEPAKDACTTCHRPHGGERRAYLVMDTTQLCASCHDSIAERMESAKYPHLEMMEGKTCSDCHNPHWSRSAKLLSESSMKICLGCHNYEIETKDGHLLDPVGEIIAESQYVHGPIRDGDCTPCHSAHGSDDPRLMKRSFPKGFYAEYHEGEYELCFGCHNPALINKRQTQATGFRDGRLNLHYTHVHNDKGRTCRACHHEHASNHPFHIRDKVTFGNWELEIQFRANENGGTCLAGCHKPKSYDRTNPVGARQAG